jgi:hypothetical protein
MKKHLAWFADEGPTVSESRLPYPTSGVLRWRRAAAPGRPKQGPTLSEGRLPYPASGVLR